MKMIYERAERVTLWLGAAEPGSKMAFQFVHELYMERNSPENIVAMFKHDLVQGKYKEHNLVDNLTAAFNQDHMPRHLRALAKVFWRPYWLRIWVVQELTVAKDILFYCGEDSVSELILSEAQRLLGRIDAGDDFPEDLLWKCLPNEPNVRSAIHFLGIEDLHIWRSALNSQNMSFFECLQYHAHRKASDPKDMIYGLAALANASSKYQIEVDYS